MIEPAVDGGSVEVGLGDQFAPVVDGQEVELVLGLQGLWMFVVNARVFDMDVGSDEQRGVIDLVALREGGEPLSLETGCRLREFVEASDGSRQLATAFMLALVPSAMPGIDGSNVTIRIQVRDREGRTAVDERTIVARLPQ